MIIKDEPASIDAGRGSRSVDAYISSMHHCVCVCQLSLSLSSSHTYTHAYTHSHAQVEK